jgi:hypothetical protein
MLVKSNIWLINSEFSLSIGDNWSVALANLTIKTKKNTTSAINVKRNIFKFVLFVDFFFILI